MAHPRKIIDLIPAKNIDFPEIDSDDLKNKDFWENYVLLQRPLIIRATHPGLENLNKHEKIRDLCKRALISKVPISTDFNFLPLINVPSTKIRHNLEEAFSIIDAAESDSVMSIPGLPLGSQIKNYAEQFHFLKGRNLRPPRIYSTARAFIYKNAATEWHYHATDETLTTQVEGKKRFSAIRLSRKNWAQYASVIEHNLHHLGVERINELASIEKFEGVLSAGDTIYIPPYWWHGVEPVGTELGITIAHCFRTPLERIGSWSEPASISILQESFGKGKILNSIFIASLISASTMLRKMKQKPWQTWE